MNMPLSAETLDSQQLSRCQNRQETRLPTALELKAQFPAGEAATHRIASYREQIRQVLHGEDDRVLIVMGPCSIHDEDAALDYARRLKTLADEVSDRFLIVMRAYLEKPRTTVGWKGLLYDPERTGKGNLKLGLERSRRLLLALTDLGLPVATEALSPFMMDYLGDLVSWTAIGARTTESQVHREMVSGLPMPVGFKNGTDGSIGVAINAMKSGAHPHHHMGISHCGSPAMISTQGNLDTHLVLRGGRGITNYDELSIARALEELEQAGVNRSVMVDCSHDNARKQAEQQMEIARDVMAQRRAGNESIRGLMLESFLVFGRQDDSDELIYGCSLTDPCLGWEQTEALIRSL